MHQKLWISDKKNVYIGSANMDWKSLAQVKELGVYVESEAVAADLTNYFENWIEWCNLPAAGQIPSPAPEKSARRTLQSTIEATPPTIGSTVAFSATFDCNLTKPCWSKVRWHNVRLKHDQTAKRAAFDLRCLSFCRSWQTWCYFNRIWSALLLLWDVAYC